MSETPRADGFAIIEIRACDLPAPYTRDECAKCSATDGYLGRYIRSNHSVAVRWVCNWCEDCTTSTDIPHAFLQRFGVTINDIPKVRDNSINPSDHWAPASIFPDWPDQVVIMCTPHHREWHARMRAHGLRWPHEIAA